MSDSLLMKLEFIFNNLEMYDFLDVDLMNLAEDSL